MKVLGMENCWHFIMACNKFTDFEAVFLILAFISECVLFHTTFANYCWDIGLLNWRVHNTLVVCQYSVWKPRY